MAISQRLRTFLEGSRVKFTTTKHPVVYTAQEIAASQHVPGRQLAKCVLVNTERGPVLAVLAAVQLIDIPKLKSALRANTLTIAKESDITSRFPDIDVGAMSPFGHLYEVPVVVDHGLEVSSSIVFNAGTHTDTVTMAYRDFAALAKPQMAGFGKSLAPSRPAKKTAATGKRRNASGRRTTRAPAQRSRRPAKPRTSRRPRR